MPVVLVKIPPNLEGEPVHSTEADIQDSALATASASASAAASVGAKEAAAAVADAVDQLDDNAYHNNYNNSKNTSTVDSQEDNDEEDEDDFVTFQNKAETMTMTEGDGTTVVATTFPPVSTKNTRTNTTTTTTMTGSETTTATTTTTTTNTNDDNAVVQEIVLEAGDATATALIESALQHSDQAEQERMPSIRKLAMELKDAEDNMVTSSSNHNNNNQNKETTAKNASHHPTTTALEEQILQKGRFVSPADFELLKVVGMGAFGKVLQVKSKVTAQVFAMKVISKRKLKSKMGYVENVKAERDILTRVRHPFVVTMHCSFQTREKLFILMDFLAGGELFLRIGREGIFLEKTAAFYLGEIILALDHLHSLGIIHRDLKPENVLLGSDGHVVLTDFGLAKDFGQAGFQDENQRALTICGTQEYMAPEMIARQGYGRAADYWSLGCLAYEMLNGLPPFQRKRNEGSKDLFRKIMTEKVKMPSGASAAACKLLKGLLARNVENRLGNTRNKMFEVGGISALKSQPFFETIDWDKLVKKEVEPPQILSVENDQDLQHFHEEFVNMALPRSVIEMSKGDFRPRRVNSENFRGFSFIQPDFALPERDSKEVEAYWNAVAEEDGESQSEVASSKCDTEDVTPALEDKKKRPPRKRKKKKGGTATGSATMTPAGSVSPSPSEAKGQTNDTPAVAADNIVESAAPTVPKPTTNDAKMETPKKENEPTKQPVEQKSTPPSVSRQINSTLNPTRKAWTPPASSGPLATTQSHAPVPKTKPLAPVPKPVATPPLPPPKPAVDQWQSASSKGKNGKSKVPPITSRGHGQTNLPSAANNHWKHATPNSANGWNNAPAATNNQQLRQTPDGRPLARGASSWGAPPPPPPPLPPSSASPSSDWRHHHMSPRTPSGGRTITQPQPAQQQFWPSLDDPALPSKSKALAPKIVAPKPKLQGAWAGRG